jgi:hypothetical protein
VSLRDVTNAADASLAPYVRADAPRGRWEGAFTLEAVYEGFLMHYHEPRAFEGMDPDLRLLAGDSLYALGLERLAAAGDLPAVAALADLISGCAQAQAEGRPEEAERLWEAFSE